MTQSEPPPPARSVEQLVEVLSPLTADVLLPEIAIRVFAVEIVEYTLPNGDPGKGVQVRFRATSGAGDCEWDDYDADEKPPCVVGEMIVNPAMFDMETGDETVRQLISSTIADRAALDIIELAAKPHR